MGEHGQPDIVHVIKGRAHVDVRASAQNNGGAARSQRQRQQQGLQHQHDRAGAAAFPRLVHVQKVIAGMNLLAGDELQHLRTEFRALHFGVAKHRRRPHRSEMLRRQPRLFPVRADILDAHRTPGYDGKAQRAAQDLAAAFAVGTVDDEKSRHLLNLSALKVDPKNSS